MLFSIAACSSKKSKDFSSYFVFKDHNIWYQYQGDKNQTPLMMLHGGPGMPSYYFKNLMEMSDAIPVIRYDQLGAGRSDTSIDTTYYTVDYYIEELEALRIHLGLNKMYLMGHSWGGFLAVAYISKYPERVQKLILASPLLDVSQWIVDADSLKAQMPKVVRDTIDYYEHRNELNNTAYLEAVKQYYDKHFLRESNPLMDSTFKYMGTEVYNYMWGNTEFNCTGTLRGRNLVPSLSKIQVPVLFTGGTYDECPRNTLKHFAHMVDNSQLHIFKDASHVTMLEKPAESKRVIVDFLK